MISAIVGLLTLAAAIWGLVLMFKAGHFVWLIVGIFIPIIPIVYLICVKVSAPEAPKS